MDFSTRMSNGWQIFKTSFKILKENKSLILFPILSGCSMIIVMASFITAIFAANSWDLNAFGQYSTAATYGFLFLFYLVNYFVIIFFNMSLIHCARAYYNGEEIFLRDGINFSIKRIGAIFAWALFAATVGTILKLIQRNTGIVGRIITGLIGVVWNIATFFVVPVIAYENVGPIGALKRSTQIMKEKWGESLTGNFSLGIIQLVAVLCTTLPLYFLGNLIAPFAGIVLAALSFFIITSVISATQTIFTGAVYQSIESQPVKDFDQGLIDDLFIRK